MQNKIKLYVCFLMIGVLLLAGCSKSGKDGAADGNTPEAAAGNDAAGESGAYGETFGQLPEDTAGTKTKDTVIAVSMPAASSGWNMQVAQAAEDALKAQVSDTVGYELLTSTDAAGQAAQLDALFSEGVDAVVIYPMDSAAIAESAVNLQNSGTPVILFNGTIDGLLPAATVMMDQELLGAKAAQKVKSKGSGMESILVFSNESSTTAYLRFQSFVAGLGSSISLVSGGNTAGDVQTAQDLMTNWLLDKKPGDLEKIGGIFAPDENSLLGIMNSLVEYEKKKGTAFENLKIIAGCGGSDELFSLIKENTKYPVNVFYYPPGAVDTAISLAFDIAAGKSYEDSVSVEAVEVDSKNAAEYMEK